MTVLLIRSRFYSVNIYTLGTEIIAHFGVPSQKSGNHVSLGFDRHTEFIRVGRFGTRYPDTNKPNRIGTRGKLISYIQIWYLDCGLSYLGSHRHVIY